MKAKSVFGKTINEISIKLNDIINPEFTPTLAIVFMAEKDQIEIICNLMDEWDLKVYGVSANREFTEENVEYGSIAILLLEINPSYFTLLYEEFEEGLVESAASEIGKKGLSSFDEPAYIVAASHFKSPADSILKGITDIAGDDATLIGGLSSDDDFVNGGVVFTNSKISRTAILALIIDKKKIEVTGYAVAGWKAFGTSKTVTKSEGRRVYTIDDQPALDVLMKYTGIEVDLNDDSDVYNQIGSSYPLQVHKPHGKPIMNPPLLFNRDDHSVLCASNVPQGSEIKFSMPPDFDVISV